MGDTTKPPVLSGFTALANRTADSPSPIPEKLPALTPKSDKPRFSESSVYPYLETNIDFLPMQFTQEPIPDERSELSVSLHGPQTPFRRWDVIREYIRGLVERQGYEDLISYKTTVERVEKVGVEWKVTLRKDGNQSDYWWVEWFDAVVVASGHYWVPYIQPLDGLEEFEKARPGSVIHSKHFRGRENFTGKVSCHLARRYVFRDTNMYASLACCSCRSFGLRRRYRLRPHWHSQDACSCYRHRTCRKRLLRG